MGRDHAHAKYYGEEREREGERGLRGLNKT